MGPAELSPRGAAAWHRYFLPVWGTGSCQKPSLHEVLLAELRMMCSCFPSLPTSPLWGLYGTLLLHYVVPYAASNLRSFIVASFREQWYSVQLRLARSSSKLLKPTSPKITRINWMWCCLFLKSKINNFDTVNFSKVVEKIYLHLQWRCLCKASMVSATKHKEFQYYVACHCITYTANIFL